MLRFDSQDLPTVLADEEVQAMVEDQMVVMEDEGNFVAVKGTYHAKLVILDKLVGLGVDYTFHASPVEGLINPQ